MPTIEITEADFRRLQAMSTPLVDTAKGLVTKLIDFYMNNQGEKGSFGNGALKSGPYEEFGPSNIPPLTHTKLLGAQFDGKTPKKTNWDSLARLSLQQVMERCGNVKDLHRMSGANVVEGLKDTDGYRFVPSHNFSYQGVSAGDAARIVMRSAKALQCGASFEFEWRAKDGAFKPGQLGVVKI